MSVGWKRGLLLFALAILLPFFLVTVFMIVAMKGLIPGWLLATSDRTGWYVIGIVILAGVFPITRLPWTGLSRSILIVFYIPLLAYLLFYFTFAASCVLFYSCL